MARRKDLLVLAGGRSAERHVSAESAANIIRNADPKRYHVRLAYIDQKGRWTLVSDPRALARHPSPAKFKFKGTPITMSLGSSHWLRAGGRGIPVDVVFPALHGPMGEDGTIQGLLELAQVPYVGSDVLGSSVGMDKAFTKRVAREAGLPVLPYVVVTAATGLKEARKLRFPVFVKPNRLGSSVGVYKVKKPSGLAAAVRDSLRYDTVLVVEQGIPARELECALLGGGDEVRISIVGEITPNAEFYSYKAKYLDENGASLSIPAPLSAKDSMKIRELGLKAFLALGCYGLTRADFMMDKRTGKIWFNEINTLPGFTSDSLYPRLWEASGIPYPRLIDRLVGLALKRHKARSRLRLAPL